MYGKILAFYARKVPDHPAKIRIFRWLGTWRPELIFSYEKRARFRVILNDFIGYAICFKGFWEPLSLSASMKIMKGHQAKIFLDVGANHGIFSILVGVEAKSQCLAIEPKKGNYEHLKKNIFLNKSLNIRAIQCAATPCKMNVRISLERAGSDAWTRVTYDEKNGGEIVEGRTLQEILKEEKCQGVRLMKIDVEGYELEVFRGLDWESSLAPEAIIMECHPSEKEKISFLYEKGYEAQTVDGKKIDQLTEYPEGNLLFIKKP